MYSSSRIYFILFTSALTFLVTGCGNGSSGTSDAELTQPLVLINDGEIVGRLVDGNIQRFLGIPYAKPPVGALRWKEPQKPDKWFYRRDASQFGNRCAQSASNEFLMPGSDNEDCLYLNVWTPATRPAKLLPVMVWIHGGGNTNGSASESQIFMATDVLTSGEFLAQRGVVVVTFNYRLGVFGFFAHSGLVNEGSRPGNQGLWDQQFALQWVHDNISRFGGDPGNVTIFGESAGSFDVCLHMASPQSRWFFHRAISESGGCTTHHNGLTEGRQQAENLSARVGCTEGDGLACLRAKSVSDILTAFDKGGSFGPIVDGDFIPDQPRTLYDRGEIARVPYLLGSNSDEGTFFVLGQASTVKDQAGLMAALIQLFSSDGASIITQQYPVEEFAGTPNPYLAVLARIYGDATLTCTTDDVAQRASVAGLSVHMYNFDIPLEITYSGLYIGAAHGAELGYVFGTSQNFTDEKRIVSDRIQRYWTNFAKTGDPNGGDLLLWPNFTQSKNVRINFALQSSILNEFRADKCAFWRAAYDTQFQ